MNKYIKDTIIFVAGLATGGVVGYIVANKKASARADHEIESMRTYYDDKCKADTSAKAKEIISGTLGTVKEAVQDKDVTVTLERKGPDNVPVSDPKAFEANMATDYGKYSEIIDVYDAKDGVKAVIKEPEQTKYLITSEEYEYDEDFEKEVLYYYKGDNVLANENEEQVSFDLIGQDKIAMFFGENPKGYIYVRDTDNEVDYEVESTEGRYDNGTQRGGVNDAGLL